MEIRIGISQSARELSFESSQEPDEVRAAVTEALKSESGVLALTDDKGRLYLVPTASLAYVEIGSEETRRIGFVA